MLSMILVNCPFSIVLLLLLFLNVMGSSNSCGGLNLPLLINIVCNEFDGRFIIGMERITYPELGFFSGHDDVIDGTWSLCAYLVASWHGISSRGYSSFPEYKGKSSFFFVWVFRH